MWSACSLFKQALRPIGLHGGQARQCELMIYVQTSIYPGCIIQIGLLKLQVTFLH